VSNEEAGGMAIALWTAAENKRSEVETGKVSKNETGQTCDSEGGDFNCFEDL
jgi:hypothetical protein